MYILTEKSCDHYFLRQNCGLSGVDEVIYDNVVSARLMQLAAESLISTFVPLNRVLLPFDKFETLNHLTSIFQMLSKPQIVNIFLFYGTNK